MSGDFDVNIEHRSDEIYALPASHVFVQDRQEMGPGVSLLLLTALPSFANPAGAGRDNLFLKLP